MANRDRTALAVAVAGLLVALWAGARPNRVGVLKKIDEKTDLIFW